MKAFIALFALAAAVSAEADPAMIYGHAGVLPYTTAGGVWGAATYPWGGYHYGKRSADAEAKPVWYNGVYGTTYGLPAVAYSGYGTHLAHWGKRSADAEAKPYWGAYGLPATTLGYGVPAVYSHWGKRSAEAKPYWPSIYGGYGVPSAYPAVYSHWGKRSADAEAEPVWYNGVYGNAYGLPAVRYSGYGTHLAHWGKRSADAQWINGYLPAYTTPSYYPYGHYLGKREAEPYMTYTAAAGVLPYAGYGYGIPAYGHWY